MKRSSLTLRSGETDVLSHILRLALTEKGIPYDAEIAKVTHDVDSDSTNPEEPQVYPLLSDRDLEIDDIQIALQYLDNKYPHPNLYPTTPETKAKYRMIIKSFENEILDAARALSSSDKNEVEEAIEVILNYINKEIISMWDPQTGRVLGHDFTVLDCYLAPIIHKLVRVREETKDKLPYAVLVYYNQMRKRETFNLSLQVRSTRGFMYEKD